MKFFKMVCLWLLLFAITACSAQPKVTRTPTKNAAATSAATVNETVAPVEPTLTTINLPVGYIPNIQFAPLYVGIEKGFYREAGLDVSIDYNMENDNAVLLANGNLQFAILSGEQVLLGRAQGLPLVYTMAWYQQYPVGIAAKATSGISTVADLRGKKIGLPGLYGASYIGAIALLDSAGLTEKDVTLDSIGYNQVEVLLADREDAVVVYVANEPIQMESTGQAITVLKVSDAIDMVANGLVTNQQTLTEKPELVRAMTLATLRAIQYTIDHPDEAYEICKVYVTNLASADQSVQNEVLSKSIEQWKSSRLGYSRPEAWENMNRILMKMGLLTSPLDLTASYTNEFIP